MASVRPHPHSKKLVIDFYVHGKRFREQTALEDQPANRKRVEGLAKRIDAAITLGTFNYREFFPNSPRAASYDDLVRSRLGQAHKRTPDAPHDQTPTFQSYVEQWWDLHKVSLRYRTQVSYRGIIDNYLIPHLGSKKVGDISKTDVLQLRSALAKVPGRNGNDTLSAKTINYMLGVLRTVLTEAADEYNFSHPMRNLKRLKQKRPEIQPFSMDEVRLILDNVRKDYRDYFVLRFFTGMRTGEIHGLRWKYVDFDRGIIQIRETWARHGVEDTKTLGSARDIHMSNSVREALLRQKAKTGHLDYVFCNRAGNPLDEKNVTQRVWYPLLRFLALEPRRPYQCRHTAATLWLAAGENPQWIATQLGHTTPEMLFRVYARFVPNLTRQDGSAFDRLLVGALNTNQSEGATS